ncbi:MAG: hypothetical protein ACSHXD_20235 [Marinosulfonomonas sp.]
MDTSTKLTDKRFKALDDYHLIDAVSLPKHETAFSDLAQIVYDTALQLVHVRLATQETKTTRVPTVEECRPLMITGLRHSELWQKITAKHLGDLKHSMKEAFTVDMALFLLQKHHPSMVHRSPATNYLHQRR